MRPEVVVGAGFGDEGKGAKVDRICRAHDLPPLVVRFSGGHQAGHTVVTGDGRRHVHAQTGSGTLAGSPTFWSKHCTFEPLGFLAEVAALRALGASPVVYIDPEAPLVTPWDKAFNQATEAANGHGSCGVGFAATVRRNADCPLLVGDILHPRVLEIRARCVEAYYGAKALVQLHAFEAFVDACAEVLRCGAVHVMSEQAVFERETLTSGRNVVFEGSQGILLDMRHGFFPHMTMARTTSLNAVEMAKRNGLEEPAIWLVTRAYQTRHGNGPMTNEDMPSPVLAPNPAETNVANKWQGSLRSTVLDLDLLQYALHCERLDYGNHLRRGLAITCLDQVDPDVTGYIPVTSGGKLTKITLEGLAMALGMRWIEGVRSEHAPAADLESLTVGKMETA